jgi:hypothetical protein
MSKDIIIYLGLPFKTACTRSPLRNMSGGGSKGITALSGKFDLWQGNKLSRESLISRRELARRRGPDLAECSCPLGHHPYSHKGGEDSRRTGQAWLAAPGTPCNAFTLHRTTVISALTKELYDLVTLHCMTYLTVMIVAKAKRGVDSG